MKLTNLTLMTAAAAMLAPIAAHAATKPTIVVMHRNIQNQKDEANWRNLALGLASEGFRVVSVALKPEENASQGRDHVVKLLDEAPEYGKVVLVGTSAASDVVSLTAEAERTRVEAVAYVSAEPSVATLGPRTVEVPSDLKVASYQIKITNGKKTTGLTEAGASTYRVREEGTSTLARQQDLIEAISTIAKNNA